MEGFAIQGLKGEFYKHKIFLIYKDLAGTADSYKKTVLRWCTEICAKILKHLHESSTISVFYMSQRFDRNYYQELLDQGCCALPGDASHSRTSVWHPVP